METPGLLFRDFYMPFEAIGDTEYALTRLDEARKQIEILTIIIKNWAA